jgi:ABC-2 type transport system ATP-binding protein
VPKTATPAGAVQVSGLRKAFRVKGGTLDAVAGIDLTVPPGQVYGLLGPNGAGKTTTLRILTTLLPADAGQAFVAGADVRREPHLVRQRIGCVGQLGGADLSATGRENLMLQGRLYGMSSTSARQRTDELIGVLDLSGFAGRIARTYSGGQRRRLEVALGIMHQPEVLFLDEPTTGLDPQNRANLWEQLRALRAAGTTIVLTTHYLDEAGQLSDRLAIIDHGRVIAEGTPAELKRQYSSDTVSVTPRLPAADLPGLAAQLASDPLVWEAWVDGEEIRLSVSEVTSAMASILATLAAAGIGIRAAELAEPSLDDVFLAQTGRSLRDTGQPDEATPEPPAGGSASPAATSAETTAGKKAAA